MCDTHGRAIRGVHDSQRAAGKSREVSGPCTNTYKSREVSGSYTNTYKSREVSGSYTNTYNREARHDDGIGQNRCVTCQIPRVELVYTQGMIIPASLHTGHNNPCLVYPSSDCQTCNMYVCELGFHILCIMCRSTVVCYLSFLYLPCILN